MLYVTSMLPYGSKEAFFLPELVELRRAGHDVIVVPMRPRSGIVHESGATLNVVSQPIVSLSILWCAVVVFVTRPVKTLRALAMLLRSRGGRIFVKNVAVTPKALWLARLACVLKSEHIHVQWAATSATMGLIASAITGIPWSFTAHRWDIREDNLLSLKMRNAAFVRAISRRGAGALCALCPSRRGAVYVGRMGVQIPSSIAPIRESRDELRVVTVANLVEVKGHAHLIDAVALARSRGVRVSVDVVGGGPLREELRMRASELGVRDSVTFLGVLEHDRLLSDMRRGRWDAVVLASIRTDQGEEEGVPVALIEGMAAGVPVVSTQTGAIEELLGDGAGILVPQKDPESLQKAFALLMEPGVRAQFASVGRARAVAEYSVTVAVEVLLHHISAAA